MNLTITGYSTALFSTWYFIDELGLLFDCGDGVTSALLQKSRKIHHALISHADRDHVTGLLQFNQLNAREGSPIIYFPKDCGSFPALEIFSKAFDPHVSGTVWKKIVPLEKIYIRDDMYIEAISNGHVVNKEGIRSLSYKVFQTKRKLKPEFAGLSGEDIRKLTLEKGKDYVTGEIATCILGYSGDTPVEDNKRWDNCEVLIHEATFIGNRDESGHPTNRNKHSTLEEVMEMVQGLKIQKLILGHFSSRYSSDEIDRSILQQCEKLSITIPVYRVIPGQTVFDILNQKPVNK